MVVIKSILAGLVAVLGFIVLLLLIPTLFHHIVVPILRYMRYHSGNWGIVFFVPHIGWIAGVIFLIGFGLEYRHAKSLQRS